MSVSIISPPLMSDFGIVSRAIGMELWLDIGRPSEQQVLELARQGREEARILIAIDQINTGNEETQKAGWKTINGFVGCEYGAIYELQAAHANEEQTGKERVFKILNHLLPSFKLGRTWSISTIATLYETNFFRCYDGFLISEKRVRQKLDSCFEEDNVYAEVACALYKKGFEEKAYKYAAESVRRGELGAWSIHALGEGKKKGCDTHLYQQIVSDGVAHKCPRCCLMSAWAEWEESPFLKDLQDADLAKISRNNAFIAARAGEVQGMILYGMMCASAFGGEKNLQEATDAFLTAYICEPSQELAVWIQRASGKSPALLDIATAFNWMIRNIDYPLNFSTLAIAGHLKNAFSKTTSYLDLL